MVAFLAGIRYDSCSDCNRMSLEQNTPASAATHWAVVLKARKEDTARAMDTMAQLCRTYWHPLYAHVRLRGHSPDEAKALTKEFFFRLLQNNKTLVKVSDNGLGMPRRKCNHS